MSGRSAHVRLKKPKAVEGTHDPADQARTQYSHAFEDGDERRSANYAHPAYFPQSPYVEQCLSASSVGSPRRQQRQLPGKPQPSLVAPVIEKSEFRVHMDGMAASVRSKLGKLIKVGGSNGTSVQRRSRKGSASLESSVTGQPQPLAFTSPTTNRGELKAKPVGTSEEQDSTNITFKSFRGDGKAPSKKWHIRPPELWDDDGDTFIYVYDRGLSSKPSPSFRVASRKIEQANSQTLLNLLRSNAVPEGWPRFCPSDLPSPDWSSSAGENSASHGARRSPMSRTLTRSDHGDIDAFPSNSSADNQDNQRPGVPYKGVQYEMYMEWPGPDSGMENTIWHIATRNYFAVLFGANTLVGTTLYEAMMTLYERLQACPEYLPQDVSPRTWLVDYIVQHNFDVVRNNASVAAFLLAFGEKIEWREGYIEGYIHAAGMFHQGIQNTADWCTVPFTTQIFVDNAHLEIESRLYRAQKWLHSFDFNEMWPCSSAPTTDAQACFDRFKTYLCKHYAGEKMFGRWPPTEGPIWLSRSVIVQLRQDFNNLYDILVDQDVVFDGFDYRKPGKWTIRSKSGRGFRADSNDLCFTDIITNFDDRHKYPHIPHPYPATPPSSPKKAKPKYSFLSKKPLVDGGLDADLRCKALAYSHATNLFVSQAPVQSDFVKKFLEFEQSDELEVTDPCEARRGRWILIYGIMQVLATVAVDSPLVRHKDGIQHHINPTMKGIVPWLKRGSPAEPEAKHELSHCWTAPNSWPVIIPQARPEAYKPIMMGQFGDGRARADLFDNQYAGKEILPSDNKTSYPERETAYVEREMPRKGIVPSLRAMTPSSEEKAPSFIADVAKVLEQGNPAHHTNPRTPATPNPAETSTDVGSVRAESPSRLESIESIGRARIHLPRTLEQNMRIGVKKAEEWMASNESQLLDSSSDSEDPPSTQKSKYAPMARNPYMGTRFGLDGAGDEDGDVAPDSASEMARKRRKEIHGFTDFKKPAGW